jgi:hypothetical protein
LGRCQEVFVQKTNSKFRILNLCYPWIPGSRKMLSHQWPVC